MKTYTVWLLTLGGFLLCTAIILGGAYLASKLDNYILLYASCFFGGAVGAYTTAKVSKWSKNNTDS